MFTGRIYMAQVNCHETEGSVLNTMQLLAHPRAKRLKVKQLKTGLAQPLVGRVAVHALVPMLFHTVSGQLKRQIQHLQIAT